MTVAAGVLDPDGPVARTIAGLWWLMVALGALAFVVFAAVLAFAFSRGAASTEEPPSHRPSPTIVAWGVVLPTVLLAATMGATAAAMRKVPDRAPGGALRVEVVGHRWWYEVRYPEHGVVTANEVHLPVGRPVEFRLRSADVIHSFWIPALGGKMDMLPDRPNTLVLRADRPGTHRSQCAEFCGLQHAKMAFVAVAEPPSAFARWIATQRRPAAAGGAAVQRGRARFLQHGCGSCHTIRGTSAMGRRGPDLTHLASRRTIGAGTVANTRAQLERWIRDPHELKEGVAMPGLAIDQRELDALLDYLGALR